MPTPKSFSELAALWVTGYTPSQIDFQNLFSSYENVKDDNLLVGNDSAITAVYPASQGTAYALTKKVNNIQVASTGTCGVKLPQAKAGMIAYVFNNAANVVNVYPFLGDGIVAGSTNAPYPLLPNQGVIFFCSEDTLLIAFSSQILQYKTNRYVAIVNQSGTAAPSATVLENTLGIAPTWARTSAGIYTLTATGLFNVAKTFIKTSISIPESPHNGGFTIQASVHTSPNVILLWCLDDGFTNVDNNQFFIDIELYP